MDTENPHMHQFKRVGVVGRLEGNAQSIDTLKHLIEYLQSKGVEIVLEDEHSSSMQRCRF